MSRILIVDDEGSNQRLFKALLEAKGYETLQAYNGPEAVKIAKESARDGSV
jgi:CheY-like chemotaxis protein